MPRQQLDDARTAVETKARLERLKLRDLALFEAVSGVVDVTRVCVAQESGWTVNTQVCVPKTSPSNADVWRQSWNRDC